MKEDESKKPEFNSLEEEVEFWENHSVVDYLDELEELKGVIYEKPDEEVISLRLDTQLVDKIRSYAQEIGIPYTVLIRMWIVNSFERDVLTEVSMEEEKEENSSSG